MLLLNTTSSHQPVSRSSAEIILALLFVGSLLWLALSPREAWPLPLIPFGIAFVIYAWVARKGEDVTVNFWLGTAILARIALVFIFPRLSDDIYRFLWDGHLILHGINPYSHIPSDIVDSAEIPALKTLFPLLNSPDYYTVYPPISQVAFTVSAFFGGNNVWLSSVFLKVIVLFSEMVTIGLLLRYFKSRGKPARALLYALNPLIIIELCGNIHTEAFMILGVVLAITALNGIRWPASSALLKVSGGLVLAIGTKLLPVIFIPFLLRRIRLRTFAVLSGIILALLLLIFTPVFAAVRPGGMLTSIDLYFRTFEFNSGIYYVAREVGEIITGYNAIARIGPGMAAVTVCTLAALFFLEKNPARNNWAVACLWALSAYFLLSTTVHPWYICGLVGLGVFTKYRFPYVWSAVAFLSYSAYVNADYSENYWLIGLEYAAVFTAISYDLLVSRRAQN